MTSAPIVHGAPLHAALLEGLADPGCVTSLVGRVEAGVGPSAVLIGDFIEKGQTGPDRHKDHGGSPVYLVLTPLDAAGHTRLADVSASFSDVLERPGVRVRTWMLAHRFTRQSDRQAPGPADWIQLVMMNVEPAAQGEFNAWYEDEHVARIAAVAPEFVRVDRMVCGSGSPEHFAFWQLRDPKAPERDPWLSASETPWTRRIRTFMRDRRRLLLVPLRPALPD